MTIDYKSRDRQRLRQARIAVAAFFFANGVMMATLPTRLPTLQAKLSLPPGQLGLALLGSTVGGLVAMNIAGRVSKRFGSKAITTLAAIGMCIALPLLAFAPNLPLLILALVLDGISNGAMDVTMNIQGADVEQAYDRPIFNSFHACFSVGSLVGALVGNILAALNILPELHFLAIAIVICAGIIWTSRYLVTSPPEASGERAKRTPPLRLSRTLMMLGIIAFCSMLSVGAMFDWSALYMSGTLHTDAGLAATGFAAFLFCMAMGRSLGDYLVTRIRAATLVRLACSLAAMGLALALLFTWIPLVLFGLGLVGFGLSVPFPLVLSATSHMYRQDTGSALSIVTTYGYFGMIAGPPVIGFIADQLGLRLALALVVSLCVIAALCGSAVNTTATKGTSHPETTQTSHETSHK